MESVEKDADGLHSTLMPLDAALCSAPPAPASEDGNLRFHRPCSRREQQLSHAVVSAETEYTKLLIDRTYFPSVAYLHISSNWPLHLIAIFSLS